MSQRPDRRRNKMYLTNNTEYHVRDGRCVAVRLRPNGTWVNDHPAVGQRLEGGVRFHDHGSLDMRPDAAEPGDVLFFSNRKKRGSLVTTALLEIGRPTKKAVREYGLQRLETKQGF